VNCTIDFRIETRNLKIDCLRFVGLLECFLSVFSSDSPLIHKLQFLRSLHPANVIYYKDRLKQYNEFKNYGTVKRLDGKRVSTGGSGPVILVDS
jgi:hypothetical protein